MGHSLFEKTDMMGVSPLRDGYLDTCAMLPNVPDREETALERILMTIVRKELPRCIKVVRQYIPLKKYPEAYLVRSNKNLRLKGMLIPDWVRALTIRDTVYILAYKEQWNTLLLKKVLCHELFHAAVYRYFGEEKTIPYWFNEAVAYSLVKREFGTETIATEEQFGSRKICELPQNIRETTLVTSVDYVSTYLLKHYDPYAIRKTLKRAKESGGFERAMRTILHLDTSDASGSGRDEESTPRPRSEPGVRISRTGLPRAYP